MARWSITITGKGVREATVKRLAGKIQTELGEGVSVSVSKITVPQSRAERFADALSKTQDAKEEFESLRDELQDWFDNLPEQFQSGDKGSELEEAIQQLEEAISHAEDLDCCDVSFPSMY